MAGSGAAGADGSTGGSGVATGGVAVEDGSELANPELDRRECSGVGSGSGLDISAWPQCGHNHPTVVLVIWLLHCLQVILAVARSINNPGKLLGNNTSAAN